MGQKQMLGYVNKKVTHFCQNIRDKQKYYVTLLIPLSLELPCYFRGLA